VFLLSDLVQLLLRRLFIDRTPSQHWPPALACRFHRVLVLLSSGRVALVEFLALADKIQQTVRARFDLLIICSLGDLRRDGTSFCEFVLAGKNLGNAYRVTLVAGLIF